MVEYNVVDDDGYRGEEWDEEFEEDDDDEWE